MTTDPLQHVDNPPAPHGIPRGALATWRHVAPQVCRWSNVTALDLSTLEVFVMSVHHLDGIEEYLQAASKPERRPVEDMRDQFRELVGEWCQSFLLGFETLEEITAPSGRTLAQLLGRGDHV